MKKGLVTLITLLLLLGGVMPLHAQGDKTAILFEANFDDSADVPGELLVFTGIEASVVDGALQLVSREEWGGFDVGTVWSDDYAVEARVNLATGGEFDIYIRNQSTNYICAYGLWALAGSNLETGAWIGDNCDEGSDWVSYGQQAVTVPNQEWFTVRLTVIGSTFTAEFNGEQVFSIQDSVYTRGRPTVSISPNSTVLIDDLVVYSFAPASGASQLGAFMGSQLLLKESFDDAQFEPGINADVVGEFLEGAWHLLPMEQVLYIEIDQVLTDYALEVDLKIMSGNGLDVNIRTQDANFFCSYVYWLDADVLRLGKWTGVDCDQDSNLDNLTGRAVQFPRGEWVTLRVQAIGNVISLYFNGELALTFKDDTYTQGVSWLAVWENSELYLDELRLYDLQ